MNPSQEYAYFLLTVALPLLAVGLPLAWWMYSWQMRRADRMMAAWTQRHGVRIVGKFSANFSDGPAGTRQSPGWVKWRIRVVDAEGHERIGVLTLGGHDHGVLTNRTEIVWADDPDHPIEEFPDRADLRPPTASASRR